MKIYMLIPIGASRCVKIKERNYSILRSALTVDYSSRFGSKNEYYIDVKSKRYDMSRVRDAYYGTDARRWYYTALDPINVIKKRIKRVEEVKV